jgi:hypothetical protein
MPQDNRIFWWCGGQDGAGHVVGELGTVDLECGKVTGLMLYKESVWMPPKIMPPLRMRLIGTALDISCTLCKNKYHWHMGEGALTKLLATLKK